MKQRWIISVFSWIQPHSKRCFSWDIKILQIYYVETQKTVKIILKGKNFTHNCTAWQQNFNYGVLCKMEQSSKNRELNSSKKETKNGPTQLRTVIQKSLWMIQIFLKPSEQENGLKLICLWTRQRHMQRTGLHIRKNSNQKYFICTEAGHIESMKKLN